jgi:myo-inositol-1(or 4)-monophosphatase
VSASSDAELDQALGFALELARSAGALVAAARAKGPVEVRAKSSPTDWVTELDAQSERHITAALRRRFPADALLGEEGADEQGSSGRTWVIDPIDGTTNFVYGYGSYAISIACRDEEGGAIGVVYDPVRDECFSARRGGGAFLDGRPLRLAPPPPLERALVGTGFGYAAARRAGQAEVLGRLLPAVRDIRRGGSAALDCCSVAAGRLDAYYEGGLGEWDYLAGLLVATEAGAAHRFVEGILRDTPTLVLAAPPLHAELLGLLAPGGAA